MDARTPHYLRFARTLALATTLALPACADEGAAVTPDEASGEAPVEQGARPDPAAAPTARLAADAIPTPAATSATDTATDTETAENDESDAGAEGDASYAGKSSGPLPPPEMPSLGA